MYIQSFTHIVNINNKAAPKSFTSVCPTLSYTANENERLLP